VEKHQLGNTSLMVSRLSCGGLFVSAYGAEFEEGKKAVHRALELGVNYVDTAPGYANSEEVLGQFLDGVDRPVYLSTKLGGRPKPFDPRNRDHLFFSVDESLRLLKRDVIDILFIHEPDRPGQYDWFESWDTFYGPVCDVLEELKARGLIRYTGLGGTTVYEMARIVEKGNYDVLLTAFNYSLLWREAGTTLIPAASKKGMGIVAGSPLQQGWLARRWDSVIVDHPPAWLSPQRREQFTRLYEFVEETGIPLPEMALRFVLSNPLIHTVLMGVRSAQEVEMNVAAAEAGPLPAKVLAELQEIAAMVPFRPCQEPMGAVLGHTGYRGPGELR
jgi:aryl-alcohol dehydrogenase-like predicted oxidoreductase